MSEIDSYKHECIGMVHCPTPYAGMYWNPPHEYIPLYTLGEDAWDAGSWQAKRGDLLLGGGSGEAPALRISIPAAFYFFTIEDWDAYDSFHEIYQAYWPMTAAYVFGVGYAKLGWTPQDPLETWVTEHILAFILQAYPDKWRSYCGPRRPGKDGTICRVPTLEEKRIGRSRR
jgi:hypothetical protein